MAERSEGIDGRADAEQVLAETYEQLTALRSEGRNHIWGFAARNLVRPVWLGQQEQRPDVLRWQSAVALLPFHGFGDAGTVPARSARRLGPVDWW